MKVFGWTGFPPAGVEVPGMTHARQQVRCIVAARSRADVARIVGVECSVASFKRALSETGNAEQIEVATSKPGSVFLHALGGRHGWVESAGGAR